MIDPEWKTKEKWSFIRTLLATGLIFDDAGRISWDAMHIKSILPKKTPQMLSTFYQVRKKRGKKITGEEDFWSSFYVIFSIRRTRLKERDFELCRKFHLIIVFAGLHTII